MYLYVCEIQTFINILKFNSANSITKQKWNCYKSGDVMVNDHDEEYLDHYVLVDHSRQVHWHVESILSLEVALSREQFYVRICVIWGSGMRIAKDEVHIL
jgi:hypothetical protein